MKLKRFSIIKYSTMIDSCVLISKSLLERLAKEEDVLLQEQNEINEKISSDEV